MTETIKVYAQYEPTSTEVVRDQPAVWPDPTYIAVSGDGGFHSVAQQAVNNIVRGWNPDAYFYTGDNSYYSGLPGEFYWNQAYAQDFIDSKKYFVCYGNHDFYNAANPASGGAGYDLSIETNYYNYLPGNGRYYHVRIGHVELFVVNDGVNSNEDPGFTGNGLMPAEPDGNWCEAPYSPVGTGIKSPTAANAVATVSGVTYTIHTFKSYGDHGDRYYPNYVVYQSGTYTDGQSFVSSGGDALAYGEPCMDPAPSQVVLRQARRYRVIANPGNNYVDYDSVRYYGGDIVQADLVLDDTTATVTGTVRLDRMNSLQAEAIKTWLSESQAPWKVVMYHHPNEHSDQFSSGHTAGSYPRTDWPWSHVHSYGRYLIDGVTHIIIGIGGQSNKTFKTTAYVSPYAIVEYNKSAISAAAAPTDYGAMHWTATPTKLEAYVQTLTDGVVDTWTLEKPEGVRAYQARPEDDIEDTASDMGDEYPWRRDTVAGGELVDTATYNPSSLDVEVVQVGQTVAVFSHTGAQ
ncbi:MAG: metallophosphoesterase [Rhodoferax sp.]|nr:metallophosphoesterase [Rhodoferax sp.]